MFFIIEETIFRFSTRNCDINIIIVISATQCNTLNVKLSNLQTNKLKSGIKNVTQVTLNLSLNAVGESNDESNFLHKLFLTNSQVFRLPKAFANGSPANKKCSKINCLR